MRILQVVHSFPPHSIAGTEVYARNVSEQFSHNHDVLVFHRISNPHLKEYELLHTSCNGFKICAVNNTFRKCHNFRMTYHNRDITERFSSVLDEFQPEIAHIHHLLFLSIDMIDELKKRDIPVIFTLHDYWLMCHIGQFLTKNLDTCETIQADECVNCLNSQLAIKKGIMATYQTLRKLLPNIFLQIAKNAYIRFAQSTFLSHDRAIELVRKRTEEVRRMLSMVDMFIAPSHFLRNKFITFGIPESKIIVSNHGFKVNDRVVTRKHLNNSRKLSFGFIGTLLPSKGVHVLIEAFNNFCSPQCELKIYGRKTTYKGFEVYSKDIGKLARGRKNITFKGDFNNDAIRNVMAEIDVLVVPSIWHENAPLVIQEAFSSGTPVIATNMGGIPEFVHDGIDGLLFKRGDVNDLVRKMNFFVENKERIEEFGNRAPKIKSIEENAKELEEIYVKLISQRN